MKQQKKGIILYSSSIAMIIAAFSAWLVMYAKSPQTADYNELASIKEQLMEASKELSAGEQGEETLNSSSVKTGLNTVMGWWYPGEPACNAVNEATRYKLDVIKPEYFMVAEGGKLELMTEENYGCNGYSPANVQTAKQVANQQFVVVSASYAPDIKDFLINNSSDGKYTNELVNFVTENGFTGVELDFEDYGGWTQEIYTRYKNFLSQLGFALHQKGKELMVDLPAVQNDEEELWYTLRLTELEKLPVDYLVIMSYDNQYDMGVGSPVAPLVWLENVINFTKSRLIHDQKIVMGIPSYGYIVDNAGGNMKNLTTDQAKEYAIYSSAKRDPSSKELIARGGKMTLVYQDAESIQAKIDVVTKNGIDKISVWHLGGNSWFLQ